MDSGSTKYDRDTPENHVCNKKPKIYKWVNKRFASTFNKFDPSVSKHLYSNQFALKPILQYQKFSNFLKYIY